MALIDDIKNLCDRLSTQGWRDLLLNVTGGDLDIQQTSRPKLEDALSKTLSIDRTAAGFEDFNPRGDQGVVPGSPSHSLLYHALACPDVHPTTSGQPSSRSSVYATLAELDALENYVYSLVKNRGDLDNTVVAVFAYQYRVANRTSHLRHADLAFSRTGIARVGTGKFNYDAARRSFGSFQGRATQFLYCQPAMASF